MAWWRKAVHRCRKLAFLYLELLEIRAYFFSLTGSASGILGFGRVLCSSITFTSSSEVDAENLFISGAACLNGSEEGPSLESSQANLVGPEFGMHGGTKSGME